MYSPYAPTTQLHSNRALMCQGKEERPRELPVHAAAAGACARPGLRGEGLRRRGRRRARLGLGQDHRDDAHAGTRRDSVA